MLCVLDLLTKSLQVPKFFIVSISNSCGTSCQIDQFCSYCIRCNWLYSPIT